MTSRLVSKGAVNVFLLIAAAYTLLPLTWLLFASTKSLSDLYSTPGFALSDLNLGANLSAVAAEEGARRSADREVGPPNGLPRCARCTLRQSSRASPPNPARSGGTPREVAVARACSLTPLLR